MFSPDIVAGEQPHLSFAIGEVAKGSPDRRRDLPHLIAVAVGAASPGKIPAEEAVIVATRHDVDVEVRHALADDVVDGHKRAIGLGRLGDGACQALREGKERTDLSDRQIRKRCHVRPGYEQDVAWQERAPVEKRDARRLIEDDLRRCVAADDRAEDASVVSHPVDLLELDVEDHDG